jgi:hypothetical protein
MRVAVLDKNGKPLMPCFGSRANKLVWAKKADIVCANPKTIRLRECEGGDLQETQIKLDPGSKITGVTVAIKGANRGWIAVMAMDLHHRGQEVVTALLLRAMLRRSRRNRNLHYRRPRFDNRTRKAGWLPPLLGPVCEAWTGRKPISRNGCHGYLSQL